MRYTPEEYALIGEKAEVVNAAFRNTASYNNINIESELKHISIPTLIIQGEQDYVVGTGHARLIYKALSGLSETTKNCISCRESGIALPLKAPALYLIFCRHFFKGKLCIHNDHIAWR